MHTTRQPAAEGDSSLVLSPSRAISRVNSEERRRILASTSPLTGRLTRSQPAAGSSPSGAVKLTPCSRRPGSGEQRLPSTGSREARVSSNSEPAGGRGAAPAGPARQQPGHSSGRASQAQPAGHNALAPTPSCVSQAEQTGTGAGAGIAMGAFDRVSQLEVEPSLPSSHPQEEQPGSLPPVGSLEAAELECTARTLTARTQAVRQHTESAPAVLQPPPAPEPASADGRQPCQPAEASPVSGGGAPAYLETQLLDGDAGHAHCTLETLPPEDLTERPAPRHGSSAAPSQPSAAKPAAAAEQAAAAAATAAAEQVPAAVAEAAAAQQVLQLPETEVPAAEVTLAVAAAAAQAPAVAAGAAVQLEVQLPDTEAPAAEDERATVSETPEQPTAGSGAVGAVLGELVAAVQAPEQLPPEAAQPQQQAQLPQQAAQAPVASEPQAAAASPQAPVAEAAAGQAQQQQAAGEPRPQQPSAAAAGGIVAGVLRELVAAAEAAQPSIAAAAAQPAAAALRCGSPDASPPPASCSLQAPPPSQGWTPVVTASMLADSADAASQLRSLADSQAQANAALERYTGLLQHGQVEGGVYYARSDGEMLAVEEQLGRQLSDTEKQEMSHLLLRGHAALHGRPAWQESAADGAELPGLPPGGGAEPVGSQSQQDALCSEAEAAFRRRQLRATGRVLQQQAYAGGGGSPLPAATEAVPGGLSVIPESESQPAPAAEAPVPSIPSCAAPPPCLTDTQQPQPDLSQSEAAPAAPPQPQAAAEQQPQQQPEAAAQQHQQPEAAAEQQQPEAPADQPSQPQAAAEQQPQQPEAAIEEQPQQPKAAAEQQPQQPEAAAEQQPQPEATAERPLQPEAEAGEQPRSGAAAEERVQPEAAAEGQLQSEAAAESQSQLEAAADRQLQPAVAAEQPQPEGAAEEQPPPASLPSAAAGDGTGGSPARAAAADPSPPTAAPALPQAPCSGAGEAAAGTEAEAQPEQFLGPEDETPHDLPEPSPPAPPGGAAQQLPHWMLPGAAAAAAAEAGAGPAARQQPDQQPDPPRPMPYVPTGSELPPLPVPVPRRHPLPFASTCPEEPEAPGRPARPSQQQRQPQPPAAAVLAAAPAGASAAEPAAGREQGDRGAAASPAGQRRQGRPQQAGATPAREAAAAARRSGGKGAAASGRTPAGTLASGGGAKRGRQAGGLAQALAQPKRARRVLQSSQPSWIAAHANQAAALAQAAAAAKSPAAAAALPPAAAAAQQLSLQAATAAPALAAAAAAAEREAEAISDSGSDAGGEISDSGSDAGSECELPPPTAEQMPQMPSPLPDAGRQASHARLQPQQQLRGQAGGSVDGSGSVPWPSSGAHGFPPCLRAPAPAAQGAGQPPGEAGLAELAAAAAQVTARRAPRDPYSLPTSQSEHTEGAPPPPAAPPPPRAAAPASAAARGRRARRSAPARLGSPRASKRQKTRFQAQAAGGRPTRQTRAPERFKDFAAPSTQDVEGGPPAAEPQPEAAAAAPLQEPEQRTPKRRKLASLLGDPAPAAVSPALQPPAGRRSGGGPSTEKGRLGCSKCRWAAIGCRVCRAKAGAPEQPASGGGKRRRRSSLGGGPLAGLTLLLSGVADRAALEQRVRELGGTVAAATHDPQGAPAAFHAVVCGSPQRTHKVLAACILGRPLLRPAWLAACAAAGAALPMAGEHAWRPASPGCACLRGKRLALAAPEQRAQLEPLLQLCGATVAEPEALSFRRGVRAAAAPPLPDFLIADGSDGEAARLQQAARQQGVPVCSERWLLDTMAGDATAEPEAAAEQPQPVSPAAALSPLLPKGSMRGVASRGPPEARAVAEGRGSQRIAWLEAADAPPEGLGLASVGARVFFAGFRWGKAGMEVRVGDCVELAPLPGEQLPRIARVEALWSDLLDGRERMLAACRLYQRPQLTYFHSAAQHPHEVFLTPTLSEEASLLAVQRKVAVLHVRAGARLAGRPMHDEAGLRQYYCAYRLQGAGLSPLGDDA